MSLNEMGSALHTALAGGTALVAELGGTAIWEGLAPQGTSLPYVVYFHSGGGDDNDSPRRARSPLWTVKAVAETQQKAKDIDDEVDALLHLGSLSLTSWNHYWIAREADVRYTEPGPGGAVYWHYGGQYRVRIAE